MKKYFIFDNEPITGWTFFLRNLLALLGLLFFIVPGIWMWAANGYKRAGAFNWSKEMRVFSAIAVVLAQISNILSKDQSYIDASINFFDLAAIPCGILCFILLVKNGNKQAEETKKASAAKIENELDIVNVPKESIDTKKEQERKSDKFKKV